MLFAFFIMFKFIPAGVAELADAQDLKSCDPKGSCGFDPRPRHHLVDSR